MNQDAAARSCARSGNFIETDRPDLSVGRITSDLPKSCQAPKSKIFCFTILEIRTITSPVPRPQEGRIMIVTTRGARDVMDALASGTVFVPDETPRRTAKSCGPDAAMLASSLWSNPQVTVANKPAHRGERDISRKTIAQGMSECFRCPVCSCAPTVQFLAHETAGAARTRHSLRPRFSREATVMHNSGKSCRENEHVCFHVIASE